MIYDHHDFAIMEGWRTKYNWITVSVTPLHLAETFVITLAMSLAQLKALYVLMALFMQFLKFQQGGEKLRVLLSNFNLFSPLPFWQKCEMMKT